MQEDRIGRSQKKVHTKGDMNMNIKKFAKQATVLTFTTALLAGGATQAFAKENTQKPYKETYGVSHITRHDMLQIPKQQQSEKYQVPDRKSVV